MTSMMQHRELYNTSGVPLLPAGRESPASARGVSKPPLSTYVTSISECLKDHSQQYFFHVLLVVICPEHHWSAATSPLPPAHHLNCLNKCVAACRVSRGLHASPAIGSVYVTVVVVVVVVCPESFTAQAQTSATRLTLVATPGVMLVSPCGSPAM